MALINNCGRRKGRLSTENQKPNLSRINDFQGVGFFNRHAHREEEEQNFQHQKGFNRFLAAMSSWISDLIL